MRNLLTQDRNVSEPVKTFLKLTGISIKDDLHNDEPNRPKTVLTISSGKLQEVVSATQGKIDPTISWLMKGKRWEMYNPILTPTTAKRILKTGLQDLGFRDPVYPQKKEYKGIFLLGSVASRFHERVIFANQLPQNGISFKNIYILTGKRPLEMFEREYFSFLENINDEGEMTLAIFKKDINPKLQENYTYVYSEAPFGSDRATTESTMQALMKYRPEPGTWLAVSNGYFIPYQALVIQNYLDKIYPAFRIKVEGVGPADTTSLEGIEDRELINKASIFLDNLSRILYNLQIREG